MADGPPKDGIHRFYDIGTELGRGSFATVYRAVCRADGKTYAIKMVKRNRLRVDGQGATSIFMKEVQILEKLHHPNICFLKETFYEPKDVVLVLEYIDGGDLLDYIVNRDGLAEDEARHLAFQLCKALKYIHAKGIAHRDLKPENILLTRDDPPILKIADFGLAKAVDSMTRFRVRLYFQLSSSPCLILDRQCAVLQFTSLLKSFSEMHKTHTAMQLIAGVLGSSYLQCKFSPLQCHLHEIVALTVLSGLRMQTLSLMTMRR